MVCSPCHCRSCGSPGVDPHAAGGDELQPQHVDHVYRQERAAMPVSGRLGRREEGGEREEEKAGGEREKS